MRLSVDREGSVTELDQVEANVGNGQIRTDNEMDVLDNNGTTLTNNEETTERTPSTDEQESTTISSEFEAQISERAAIGFNDNTGQGSPRVQFERIQEETTELGQIEELIAEEDKKIRRHHKHDHK